MWISAEFEKEVDIYEQKDLRKFKLADNQKEMLMREKIFKKRYGSVKFIINRLYSVSFKVDVAFKS